MGVWDRSYGKMSSRVHRPLSVYLISQHQVHNFIFLLVKRKYDVIFILPGEVLIYILAFVQRCYPAGLAEM